LQIKTKIVTCHTVKPVKQEVNGTVTLPPLVFPALNFEEFTPVKDSVTRESDFALGQ
jgi:hypothetical protein